MHIKNCVEKLDIKCDGDGARDWSVDDFVIRRGKPKAKRQDR